MHKSISLVVHTNSIPINLLQWKFCTITPEKWPCIVKNKLVFASKVSLCQSVLWIYIFSEKYWCINSPWYELSSLVLYVHKNTKQTTFLCSAGHSLFIFSLCHTGICFVFQQSKFLLDWGLLMQTNWVIRCQKRLEIYSERHDRCPTLKPAITTNPQW